MTVGLQGLKGDLIRVEAKVRSYRERCVIIGLPDASIKESEERILSCLHLLDFDMSMKQITIHLSPADIRKSGTGFDAAMLLAVIQELADEKLPISDEVCVIAALSLDGSFVPFHGLLPTLQQALRLGFKRIYLPPIDTSFISNRSDVELIPLPNIDTLLSHLRGQTSITFETTFPKLFKKEINSESHLETDFSLIRGQNRAKRALEIAAAGGHHTLLVGPPGCGKSMLATAFPTIMPNLTEDEALEVYSLYHLAREKRGLSLRPPYRQPHHSSSSVSLIGGGTFPKPGDISLAHKGILFLDELGEFPRKTLDMLRQPMEAGEITISRVRQTVTYPSSFTLIAATNPCPCGYYQSNERYCTCTENQINTYQLKVSGPILNRLDFVLLVKGSGMTEQTHSETSTEIRKRVIIARQIQRERYGDLRLNGTIPFALLSQKLIIKPEQREQIRNVCFNEKWSNRTEAKIYRIAQTISDLAGSKKITDAAIAEAIEFKRTPTGLQSPLR